MQMAAPRSSHRPSRRHRVRKPNPFRARAVPRAEELEQRLVPARVMQPIAVLAQHGHGLGPSFDPGQSPAGFWPAQVRHAYGFDKLPLDGAGQTIAIVDAYDDSSLPDDLKTFDAQFNLPDPPSFTQINQDGGSNANVFSDPSGLWEIEEALDVEWAHAIAPKANILLVEAYSADTNDLLAAVDTARQAPGVVAVSMSWGSSEFVGEGAYDSHFTTPPGHAGVTFLAASGDNGAPPGWPAVSPNVVAVGGTSLALDGSDNRLSETGWNGSGGGLSGSYREPAYQAAYAQSAYVQGTLGNKVLLNSPRGNPDVAYDADPNTGFAVHDSFPYYGEFLGWIAVGGTSAGTPQWAALLALADQGLGAAGSLDGATQTLPGLYQLAASAASNPNDFIDVTGGNNGYSAQAGYDLVTGLGSPRADNLVPDLEKFGLSTTLHVTTSTGSPTAGSPFSITVTAQYASGQTQTGYTGTVHFTSSDKGAGVVLPANYTFTAADKGTHTFTGVTLVTAGSQTITATDMANSAITGQGAVQVNPAAASSLSLTAPASTSQGASLSVTVTAKDRYGNTAAGYVGAVHFTTSDKGSGAVLPPDYSFSAADKGRHTFTRAAALVTLGNQTVTVTDKGKATLTATATVKVQAALPATHFSVSGPPSATAGSPFSVTVTALDANNNTATGYLGMVHFTTSDKGSGVALPANYTFTAADKGSHTFTNAVTLVTAGGQTVAATDKGNGTITGSTTVTVNPAAAVKLSVAGFPSPVHAGDSGTFTVTAKDAYGNTATGYNGTVTFSSSDGQAQLPPDSPLVNGTGTFTAVLWTVGTQSLTATDTVNRSITGTQSGIVVGNALPYVMGVYPNQGMTTGGYTVAIYGANFTGATAVYFGTTPATIIGDSGYEIGVIAPAHAPGTVDVTVVTPAGTSPINPADQFTYTSPYGGGGSPFVMGVDPSQGQTVGGYIVTVLGQNFYGATAVYFGTAPATIIGDSGYEIGVIAPAHAPGTVDVTVVTPAGTSPIVPADQFTYFGGPGPSFVGGARAGAFAARWAPYASILAQSGTYPLTSLLVGRTGWDWISRY
jgi:hypothetical protein